MNLDGSAMLELHRRVIIKWKVCYFSQVCQWPERLVSITQGQLDVLIPHSVLQCVLRELGIHATKVRHSGAHAALSEHFLHKGCNYATWNIVLASVLLCYCQAGKMETKLGIRFPDNIKYWTLFLCHIITIHSPCYMPTKVLKMEKLIISPTVNFVHVLMETLTGNFCCIVMPILCSDQFCNVISPAGWQSLNKSYGDGVSEPFEHQIHPNPYELIFMKNAKGHSTVKE